MANTTIEYFGRYATDAKLDNPSSIIRMIDDADADILTVEICNPTTAWREDIEQIRFIWGLSDGSYPMDANIAVPLITSWKDDWPI